MEDTPAYIQNITLAGLNLIKQALSIYDKDLRLVVANQRFQRMFRLPDELTQAGAPFADTIRLLVERGEYGVIDDPEAFIAERVAIARTFEPHYLERSRPNGTTISIEGSPLRQGGWVAVYTDITELKQQAALLRDRSADLSVELLARSEELSQTNRELTATITAL
jgi:PAS domain-containing protein